MIFLLVNKYNLFSSLLQQLSKKYNFFSSATLVKEGGRGQSGLFETCEASKEDEQAWGDRRTSKLEERGGREKKCLLSLILSLSSLARTVHVVQVLWTIWLFGRSDKNGKCREAHSKTSGLKT